jgi:hypothetical protein
MQQLSDEFCALQDSYGALLTRCAVEGRDPTAQEMAQLQELRTMSDRIVDVRETEDRRMAGQRFMAGRPSGSATGLVQVRNEPAVYSPPDARGPQPSFFRDLLNAETGGDVDARSRIDRHKGLPALKAVDPADFPPYMIPKLLDVGTTILATPYAALQRLEAEDHTESDPWEVIARELEAVTPEAPQS